MQKFSCKNSCKKTSQLKCSELCTGEFSTQSGKAIFDCDVSLKESSQELVNFLTCSLWDMGLKESCITCPLNCPKNENPIVKKSLEAKNNISSILSSLQPIINVGGLSDDALKKAYDVMNSSEINTNNSLEINEAINIANYAKDILNKVMLGKGINLAEFKKVKEDLEKKYKR
jgi:hypothetical protein